MDPTIVGIAGLVDPIQTGQVVTMDGGVGVVRKPRGRLQLHRRGRPAAG